MLEVKKKGDRIFVKPKEDIRSETVQEWRSELSPVVKEVQKEMIIDFGEVNVIDSMGLGVLVATYNSLKEAGKKMTVTNVSPGIQELFSMMRLNQYFEVKMDNS